MNSVTGFTFRYNSDLFWYILFHKAKYFVSQKYNKFKYKPNKKQENEKSARICRATSGGIGCESQLLDA